MQRRFKLLFLVLLALFSCQQEKGTRKQTLKGTWNCIGYGQRIEVDDSVAVFYDTYKEGCNFNFRVPQRYLTDYFELVKLTRDSLTLKYGLTEYDYVKAKTDFQHCSELQLANNKSALKNFDALWHTFNENYCSFNLRQINWEDLKHKYRPRLGEQSSDRELYMVLHEMLMELKDGHVLLSNPKLNEDEINQEEDDGDSLRDVVISQINKKYLSLVNSYNKDAINWGLISNDIAYIQVNNFEDLADYKINQNLPKEVYWNAYMKKAEESLTYASDVTSGITKQMDLIVNAIHATRNCIIDIRFNGGGLDDAGLAVLRHFIEERKNLFTKKARFEKGFTREQDIFIEPNENHYGGNVFILTSHQTASAAEVFLLASMNLSKAIRIGSNTEGIFSDILSKKLPNGWDYGLSNEIYSGTNGINYEKTGIPPDFNIDYDTNPKDFYKELILELKKGDRAIETAVQMTKGKIKMRN